GDHVFRDSIVHSTGNGEVAVFAGSGSPETRNVNAIATGPGSVGMSAVPVECPGPAVEATVKNVIARGEENDLIVSACEATQSQISIGYSDYRPEKVEGSEVCVAGSDNQTNLEPLFKDPGAGEYHQLP